MKIKASLLNCRNIKTQKKEWISTNNNSTLNEYSSVVHIVFFACEVR